MFFCTITMEDLESFFKTLFFIQNADQVKWIPIKICVFVVGELGDQKNMVNK